MPKTKTKKPTTKRKTKPTKITKSTDKERINLLKAELNYFKGLSIMAVVLILCVFFAFGSLFSAMYLEVKALRYSLETAFEQAAIQGIDLAAPEIDSSDKTKSLPAAEKEIEWINFEKYGFNIYFPSDWTYLDNPYKDYEKTVDLYSDGQIHDYEDPRGDVIVRVLNEWTAPEDAKYQKTVELNGLSANMYVTVANGDATASIVLNNDDNYIELIFNGVETELMTQILNKFELIEN
ncbi:hypothetical protein HN958_00275 [Candidatus Falkowbacteria bacterium]|nr:hypothetical protein [Candidatus Falkowbacteria bacterium]MBT7006924.1 hypothetical protein [Candidatus Falkowbacteria bacterium]